jgi:transposase
MTNAVYKFYIGIDVSKAHLDIALSNNSSFFRLSNDQGGHRALLKLLPAKKRTLIILEASGGYEKSIANFLRNKKYNVAIVNAKRVRDFAKASGKLAKTDLIDAHVIMEFGRAFNPTAQPPQTNDEEARTSNINRRAQLVKMIAMEKQHAEQASEVHRKQIRKHIEYLEKDLRNLEETLKLQFIKDPAMQEKLSRLDGIKGVGEVVAMTVLQHMPELGKLSHREISALAGVAPYNRDSGQKKGKRETWGGRAAVRAMLYMAVLSAKRSNVAIKQFYDGLIARGKLKKVAIVACMRKLIIIMNAMMRDNSSWRPV